MPRALRAAERHLDLQDLDHVDRREAATDDDRAGRQLIARAVVGFFGVVIEPIDELVLIDEAAIDELIRALDRKRAIAPCAVRQHDAAETPASAQVLEIELAAHPGQRDIFDIGMVEAFVDFLVLVEALLDVPSRQPVFDFSVGAWILLEHDNQRAALGEDARDFGTGSRGTDHRHYVPRRFVLCVGHKGIFD